MEVDEGAGANAASATTTAQPQTQPAKKKESSFSVDLLRLYYEYLFPYEQMFDWLSYGNDPEKVENNPAIVSDYFFRREFSFTIENDIYIRYLSFRNKEEMTKEIKKKQPHKIDIGAIYSAPAREHNTIKASAFKPLERELVFDIDLTDYDEVRTGCTKDMMWEKGSWQYMSVAVKVCDQILREDFGYKHLLWIFSGRRGVHCWVCDPAARKLEDRERAAIVNYLTLIVGNENSMDRVPLTWPLHPTIERCMPLLEETFQNMVLAEDGQNLLGTPETREKVLKAVPSHDIQSRLRSTWERESSSASNAKRWAQLKATVRDAAKKLKGKDSKLMEKLELCIYSIVILYTYPRLDVNVSTHRNHLLKSPFVVHPKTGKVCVPILDIPNCDKFDPDDVPNLKTLADEINAKDADIENSMDETSDDKDANRSAKKRKVEAYRRTSMKPYIEGFEKGFLKDLYSTIRTDFKKFSEENAAITGSW